MHPFWITLNNYRCFADSRPARLLIGPGLTGIIGKNNSGKSALLRALYELRNLWQDVASPGRMHSLFDGKQFVVGSIGTSDPYELFNNTNDRNLHVKLEFPDKACAMASVTFTTARTEPNHWTTKFEWRGFNPKTLSVSGADTVVAGGGAPVSIDMFYEAVKTLSDVLYVGPFRNAINSGSQDYYDLSIGTRFIALWDEWKNGPDKRKSMRIHEAIRDVGAVFEFTSFDVNASNDKTTFQLYVDGRPYRLQELGAGLAQFLVVFGAAAINRPSFLLIDEPELNLHPSLQRDFLLRVSRYARHGVLFASHSLGLARATSDKLVSIRPAASGSLVADFDQTRNFAEFVGELGFSAYQELGFDRIILVEGVTEVKTFQQFLRLYGKDHQVVLVPLGGSAMINGKIALELGELMRLSPNVSALIDSERAAHGDALAQDRQDFLTTCSRLGIQAHATELRATENYFTAAAIAAEFPNASALGPFDPLNGQRHWPKHANWKIAGHMAKADIETTDLGQFIASL